MQIIILLSSCFLAVLFCCIKSLYSKINLKFAISARAGQFTTFLKSFQGPSARSFRSCSFFSIVPYSFRSVPFCSVPFHPVLSRRTVIPFRSVLGVLSRRTVPSLLFRLSQEWFHPQFCSLFSWLRTVPTSEVVKYGWALQVYNYMFLFLKFSVHLFWKLNTLS